VGWPVQLSIPLFDRLSVRLVCCLADFLCVLIDTMQHLAIESPRSVNSNAHNLPPRPHLSSADGGKNPQVPKQPSSEAAARDFDGNGLGEQASLAQRIHAGRLAKNLSQYVNKRANAIACANHIPP